MSGPQDEVVLAAPESVWTGLSGCKGAALVLLALGSACKGAEEYGMGHVGVGGELSTMSVGAEIGGLRYADDRVYLGGIGLSMATHVEEAHDEGILQSEQEVYIAAGGGMSWGPMLVVTAGLAYQEFEAATASESNSDDYEGTGSVQLRYRWRSLLLSMGCHSRRGVVFGVGTVLPE